MTARPGSEQSTISQFEKSFPLPPRSRPGDRKTLPPLPPLPEIEREAAIAAALEDERFKTGKGLKKLALTLERPDKALPLLPFGLANPKRKRPVSNGPSRPATASTKRTSFTSVDPKRNLKRGTGRYSTIVLCPQPSDDANDPLNWPLWKKNLNLTALLLMVAIIGFMKTVFISAHGSLAAQLDTRVVTLTAVPLMISALSGRASMIVAKLYGKRPVYLLAAIFVFFGSALDIHGGTDVARITSARVVQGMGWGAFDTLVLGSILDTFFARPLISVATTWGAPLLGGTVSTYRGALGQFEILTSFSIISVLMIILGAPETNYVRLRCGDGDGLSLEPTRPQSTFQKVELSKDAARRYIRENMRIWSYKAPVIDQNLIMQAPVAAIAPSTLLLFVATFLPFGALWGLTSSLALLLPCPPTVLSESSIGLLLSGPSFWEDVSPTYHLTSFIAGILMASAGILFFGLYIVDSPRDRLSFPVISLVLGFVAFGCSSLDSIVPYVVQQSTDFTSSTVSVAIRNMADMQAALIWLRNFVTGLFVLTLPAAVAENSGLRSSIGIAIAQIVITAGVAVAYDYMKGSIKRLDGRVMRLVGLSSLKQRGSFLDAN
ncbi:hypothetical protein GGR57DRAFT_489375 [Xylariaceae sp. FL1272]|nr:hypothetical protein GGR57DRAFT_489375 [Xylariaceae sp. FL1272]